MLTGSLSLFSRRHRPLSRVVRVLFSLYSFQYIPTILSESLAQANFVVVVCLVHNNCHPSLVCWQYDYVLVCFQTFQCFLFVRSKVTVPGGVGHGPKGIIGKKSKTAHLHLTFALFTSLVTP